MRKATTILLALAFAMASVAAVAGNAIARHGPDQCNTAQGYKNGGTDGDTILATAYAPVLEDTDLPGVYVDNDNALAEVWIDWNRIEGLQRSERTCDGCIHEDRDRVVLHTDHNVKTPLTHRNNNTLGLLYITGGADDPHIWLETNTIPGLQTEDWTCEDECESPSDTLLFPREDPLFNFDRLLGNCPGETHQIPVG